MTRPDDASMKTYVDPQTGQPWFACPQCRSAHTRGVCLNTKDEEIVFLLCTGESDGESLAPDYSLQFQWSKQNVTKDENAVWMECGACAHGWRPDGAPFWTDAQSAEGLAGPWDWVEASSDELRSAFAVLRAAGEEPQGGRVSTLAALGYGPERVDTNIVVDQVTLYQMDTWWLDEPVGEGETGLNLHPGNLFGGDYAARFGPCEGEERWPHDGIWGIDKHDVAWLFLHVEPSGGDAADPALEA